MLTNQDLFKYNTYLIVLLSSESSVQFQLNEQNELILKENTTRVSPEIMLNGYMDYENSMGLCKQWPNFVYIKS